jgi:SAM-dependent methyltransferase
MVDVATPRDMATVRGLLGRHLTGSGVEIGPGHYPFPVNFPGVTVAYVDRWEPGDNRELFPELGPNAIFPVPNYICNLDTDRLKPLADNSQDFVVASHVLEHVAEPIGLIDDIHRVLRPGGVALILLPDRRRTFDRRRRPTPLAHLVAEFEAGVTAVDDAHIVEFLEGVGGSELQQYNQSSSDERRAILDRHRRRSIHAHCWAEDEFLPVLLYTVRQLGHGWEFVDGVTVDDEGPEGIEFGYVLRRATIELPEDVVSRRLEATWSAWAQSRRHENDQKLHSMWTDSIRQRLRQAVRRSPWHDAARRIMALARGHRSANAPHGSSGGTTTSS